MPLPSVSPSFLRHWGPLGVLLLLAVALPAIGALLLGGSWSASIEALRAQGPALIVPFVLLGGLVLGLALLPSHALSLIGGFLFGWAGYFWVCLAVLLGTVLHWSITRRWPGGALRQALERSAWGQLLARSMLDAGPWKLWLVVALARVAPQIPFALGSVLAASCRVRLGPLLAGTWLGMSPRILVVVGLGAQLSKWTPGAPLPGSAWAALVGGVLGLGGLALWSFLVLRRAAAATPATPSSHPAGEKNLPSAPPTG
jgi:uncharacterized membrane protein YdjX (TVP38/TMEM64 family)